MTNFKWRLVQLGPAGTSKILEMPKNMSKYVAAARETHCRNFGGLNCRLHAVNIFFERKNAILTDFKERLVQCGPAGLGKIPKVGRFGPIAPAIGQAWYTVL